MVNDVPKLGEKVHNVKKSTVLFVFCAEQVYNFNIISNNPWDFLSRRRIS